MALQVWDHIYIDLKRRPFSKTILRRVAGIFSEKKDAVLASSRTILQFQSLEISWSQLLNSMKFCNGRILTI